MSPRDACNPYETFLQAMWDSQRRMVSPVAVSLIIFPVTSRFLRLQSVTVYVRDLDRSLRFYVDLLGFKLVTDTHLPNGSRWIAVAPFNGPTHLVLTSPALDSEQSKFIGRDTQVVFLTEDIHAQSAAWEKQGIATREVSFQSDEKGKLVTFKDLDGNTFGLAGFDTATQRIEAERNAETEKREAELRAARELEIAREVQARLFPRTKPTVKGLEYAGICIQARHVGGDYFDFLALGPDRLGLVLGDIAGKGIAGALLMANLQANLRGQCANTPDEPLSRLGFVNQLFYDNTGDNSYATLFFGEYVAQSHRLRYANCGHLPGLLLRSTGLVERLESTSTVLGLFQRWDCVIADNSFLPGDMLVLYTDGVSEATNAADDEFGEQRLIDVLRRHRDLSPKRLIETLVEEVHTFSPFEQQDDITVIVAKSQAA